MKDIVDIIGLLSVGVIALLLKRQIIVLGLAIMSYLFFRAANDIENPRLKEAIQVTIIIVFMTCAGIIVVYLLP